MGGDVMKHIALAILLVFAAVVGSTAAWADSSDSSTVTTEAP
jgi:hypothetical protein